MSPQGQACLVSLPPHPGLALLSSLQYNLRRCRSQRLGEVGIGSRALLNESVVMGVALHRGLEIAFCPRVQLVDVNLEVAP